LRGQVPQEVRAVTITLEQLNHIRAVRDSTKLDVDHRREEFKATGRGEGDLAGARAALGLIERDLERAEAITGILDRLAKFVNEDDANKAVPIAKEAQHAAECLDPHSWSYIKRHEMADADAPRRNQGKGRGRSAG
jgi:hypothetical protein